MTDPGRPALRPSRPPPPPPHSTELAHEIAELRQLIEAGQTRLEETVAEMQALIADADVTDMLDTLDMRRDALAQEINGRFADTERMSQETLARLEALESRVGELREGTELSRIRMRLDRIGHQLGALDARLDAIETKQRRLEEESKEHHTRVARNEMRLERLDSLFEELEEEVREERDEQGIAGLVTRLDDVEALIVKTGTAVQEQRHELERLSESIAPVAARGTQPRAAVTETNADDLTRIKGIGPKFARGLHAIGITTIATIANWSDDDVERAALSLGIQAARIRKAGWVASARKLVGG